MARKVLVRLVDDLDDMPGDDVSTVTFALDGATYQIDLSTANAERLRELLGVYVDAGRRTGGRRSRSAGPRSAAAAGPAEAPAVREWARAQGHQLSDRGRIPAGIVADYRAAKNGDAEPAAKPARATTPARAARTAKTAAAAKSAPPKATATTTPGRARAAAKPAAKAAKPAAKTTTAAKTAKAAAAKPAAKAAPKAAKSRTAAPKPATRRATKPRG
jgi:hypothetical protein